MFLMQWTAARWFTKPSDVTELPHTIPSSPFQPEVTTRERASPGDNLTEEAKKQKDGVLGMILEGGKSDHLEIAFLCLWACGMYRVIYLNRTWKFERVDHFNAQMKYDKNKVTYTLPHAPRRNAQSWPLYPTARHLIPHVLRFCFTEFKFKPSCPLLFNGNLSVPSVQPGNVQWREGLLGDRVRWKRMWWAASHGVEHWMTI
ncbi:hypothetical protein EDC04DRAFT_2607702 [Pisolithus marmoratus]|nr:hypothetical protein EDC04DRAFT_2607702 [Pisolithus marmoratus]